MFNTEISKLAHYDPLTMEQTNFSHNSSIRYVPTIKNYFNYLTTGLPEFYWYNIPKRGKYVYQITLKYIKRQQNIQNGHKIDQMAIK
jgi:hypothetical protein